MKYLKDKYQFYYIMLKYLIIPLVLLTKFSKGYEFNLNQIEMTKYACTDYSPFKTIEYYHATPHKFKFPQTWNQVSSKGQCIFECQSCDTIYVNGEKINVGFSASCKLNEQDIQDYHFDIKEEHYHNEIIYQKYDNSNKIFNNIINQDGIYIGHSNHPYISEYKLCIFKDVSNNINTISETFNIKYKNKPRITPDTIRSAKRPKNISSTTTSPSSMGSSDASNVKFPKIIPQTNILTKNDNMNVSTLSVTNSKINQNNLDNNQKDQFHKKVIISIIIFFTLLLTIIGGALIYDCCLNKKHNNSIPDDTIDFYNEKIPDDLNNLINILGPEYNLIHVYTYKKFMVPNEITSGKILYTDIDNNIAMSWTSLSSVTRALFNDTKIDSYFSPSNFWSIVTNDFNLLEYRPTATINVKKCFYYSGSTKPNEIYNVTLNRIIFSYEKSEYLLCIFNEDSTLGYKYVMVINKKYLDMVLLKSNLPELYIFDNFSFKTWENFGYHYLQDKVKRALKIRNEFLSLSNSRPTKLMIAKYNESSQFLDWINTISKGLQNYKSPNCKK